MIGNSFQLIVKRTLSHWRLLSAVVVGVVLASTIMASSVIFFDALRDVALQRALSTHEQSELDVLVEAGQVPTNPETHSVMVDAMNGSIVRNFSHFLDQTEFAIKTWTFFVDLPPALVDPADCPCSSNLGTNSGDADGLIECDCRRVTMMTLPKVENRVNIVEGSLARPATTIASDDSLHIEGIIDVQSASAMGISVGDIYPARPHWEDTHDRVNILVTGLYERADPEKDHWRIQNEAFGSRTDTLQFARFVVPEQTILEGLGPYFPNMGTDYAWWLDIDPERIAASETESIRNTIDATERELKAIVDGFLLRSDLPQVLSAFETDLFFNRLPMFIVLILIVLVVLYYVVTLASLLVDAQRSEVELLRTRGATSRQILAVFVIEAGFLAAIAAVTGPFLALLGVGFIGVLPIYSELNGGDPLPVRLTLAAFRMAFFGGLLGLLALFIPALRATRLGLLASRVSRARPAKLALVQRYYLDLGFLALVMFLFWQLTKQGSFVAVSIFGETTVNQLILGVPAIFLVAAGLVLLRIFPVAMDFTGRILSRRPLTKITPPAFILVIWQMARNPAHHSRLSLLLILTAALGVFASSFGATLQQSAIDTAYYRTGADVKITGLNIRDNGVSVSVVDELSELENVEAASPIYRETANITSGVNVEGFQFIGVNIDTIEDVGWFREDFDLSPFDQKAAVLNVGGAAGIELPTNGRWLTARILPLIRQPSTFLVARLSDANGQFFSVPLGTMVPLASDQLRFNCGVPVDGESPEWCRIGSAIQATPFRGVRGLIPLPGMTAAKTILPVIGVKLPIRLHSIGVIDYENGLAPAAIDIDDIAVLDETGTELVIIETFDSVNNWRTMAPTREALGDNLGYASLPDGTPVEGVARLRWTSSLPREYRGLAHGSELEIVPVIASTTFIERYGGEEGKPIQIALDGVPFNISIRDVIDYFPTLALDEKPFLIADFESIHERLNITRTTGNIQPTEYWISTIQGSELLLSEEGVLESVVAGDRAIPDIINKLSALRIRPGSNVLDRSQELAGVAFDPLVSAGWRALLGIAFFTVLIVSAIGFLVHAKVSFDGRRTELALLRTIGLSMKQMLFLVVLEQVMVIGVAVALGILMGARMGSTIMPYLASSGENAVVVPPMAVKIDWLGFGITFGLLGVVFLVVIGLILISVYRMSIHRIMRMGES
ncbi:MAG: FtsX-like permease family protein [Dehalococcoidia bacterium]|nr:FtsX-like permease family protein [Dehalococcoidia bacterium]